MESSGLEDVKINVKFKLSALWASHFLIWTFGDMIALLQETTKPISSELLLFVAVPTAVVQTFMIIFPLIGEAKMIRWTNIGVTPVFMLFNIGYLADHSEGGNYLLGTVYILLNVLIIWHAWKWPQVEDGEVATE